MQGRRCDRYWTCPVSCRARPGSFRIGTSSPACQPPDKTCLVFPAPAGNLARLAEWPARSIARDRFMLLNLRRFSVILSALPSLSMSPALGADPSALWQIDNGQCVPHMRDNHDPAPCSIVDLTTGYV